jgi:hypothetical protein
MSFLFFSPKLCVNFNILISFQCLDVVLTHMIELVKLVITCLLSFLPISLRKVFVSLCAGL